jgi:hypothetical protein
MKYLSLVMTLVTLGFAYHVEINLDQINYTIAQDHGFDRLCVLEGGGTKGAPGSPEIPTIARHFLIPQHCSATDIRIVREEWQELPGTYYLFPVQKPVSFETTYVFTIPDSTAYNGDSAFPCDPCIDFRCGNTRGYRVLQITCALFKYLPRSGQLYRLSRIELDITMAHAPGGVHLFRQTSFSQRSTEHFLNKLVVNNECIQNGQYKPLYVVEDNPKDVPATEFPSRQGPAVDLVVITDYDQLAAYKDLARFKKILGMNCEVRSIPWIRQYYNGLDDAERVRNFIKDAYINWGTSFVILGGDVPAVPTRYIWVDRTTIYASLWLPIASDLYFSDLDGTWDYDGDERFGELSDSVDLFPDVFVGRIPTVSASEVEAYIGKLHRYVLPVNNQIQTKALFFSSYLDTNLPGLSYCTQLAEHLPSYFKKHFIAEALGNLTVESLYDSLHAGFGLVTGVGHGDVNNMCVHWLTYPRQYIKTYFYDTLTNDPLYSGVLVVVTCYTNPFQGDCLGEHWVMNPFGGGIAYLGPTSSSEGSIHKEYMKTLFDSLFAMPLGQALGFTKVQYIGNAQSNNWQRVHQFSLSLLGDPTLTMWKTCPLNFSDMAVTPETLNIGVDTLTFDFGPSVHSGPIDVVFYKEDELFMRDSVSGGQLTAVVETESAGYVKYAVISEGYGVYVDSVVVVPGAAYCACGGYWVVDTVSGNGNGLLEPGEEAVVYVVVVNQGGVVASGVRGQLVSGDSVCAVVVDTAWYGDLGSGMSGVNVTGYEVVVGDWLVDGQAWVMWLVMSYGGSVSVDSFAVQGVAPELVHFGQWYAVCAETVKVWPWVENQGHSGVDTVQGVIAAVLDSVVVVDSVVVFVDVGVGAVRGAVDSFVVVRGSGSMVAYEYQLVREGQVVGTWSVYLDSVARVDSVRALGRRETVVVEWEPVPGVCGYRVYRGVVGSGLTYVGNLLQPMSYYEDYLVQPGVEYQYCVVAVDQSMNHSPASDTVIGKANALYASGWPQPVYDYMYSSPHVGDIDPAYLGLEVVVAGHDGCVYGWHCDGTSILEGNILFNAGSGPIWSSPAIGDINNDGLLDIVFGVQKGGDNLYAVTYHHASDTVFVLPGWPKSLAGGGLVSSPVLADIDQDGDLEIFAMTLGPACLYAFHHDGVGVFDSTSGVLEYFGDVIFGTPAVGDVDRDGYLDIVCCARGDIDSLMNTIFVWDHNGDHVSPFPVQIGLDTSPKYSVAIGDVCGDARLEIAHYVGAPSNSIFCTDADGTILWQYQLLAAYNDMNPIIADVTGDDHPEVILGFNDGLDAGLIVFDSAGAVLPGYPVRGQDFYFPIAVDIDNDECTDIVAGCTEWEIFGFHNDGTVVSGFPIKLGNRVNSSPAVYDIDLDGQLEMMVSCFDYAFHVFDLTSHSFEWPCYRYDPYNTGCYRSGYYTSCVERKPEQAQLRFCMYTHPNPFSAAVSIFCTDEHQGVRSTDMTLKVYDVCGRLIRDFSSMLVTAASATAGSRLEFNLTWNGDDEQNRWVPAGVYFIRFTSGNHSMTHKLVKIH